MIKLFKLINSETVIADAEKNLDNEWILQNPHLIMIIPQPNGQLGVSLIDYLVGAIDDYTVTLKENKMICEPVDINRMMSNLWDNKMKDVLKQKTGIEVISKF